MQKNNNLLDFEVRFCGFKTEDEGAIHRLILQNRLRVPYKADKKYKQFASEFLV